MILLTGVCRVFRMGDQDVNALRDIDLEIAAGDYISLMGPSGSGKSTLLNVLGLLDSPTSGRYLFDGRDVVERGDDELAAIRQRRIGFVFQSFHLIPRLSAADNIGLPMTLAGVDPAARRARIGELLKRFGLGARGEHKPAQLSGGERQRVAIARAISLNPALVLADEPTGNLDTASGDEVLAALEQLNAEGITLILVTHDPDLGRRARRHIRLLDGAIVVDEKTP